MDKYLDYIDMKVRCLCGRMFKVRKLGRLKLNINLFKVLIMPLIRMGAINASLGNASEWLRFGRSVRGWFKSYCMLPKTIPNATVRWLLGDT